MWVSYGYFRYPVGIDMGVKVVTYASMSLGTYISLLKINASIYGHSDFLPNLTQYHP